MDIDKISTVSFSPTGNSRQIVKAIASGMLGIPVAHIDLTSPAAKHTVQFGARDLVVIGVPVYAGRVAASAVTRLRKLSGNATPVVIVATYGNRAFEDAVIELQDITEDLGFLPIAAGAFVGEHSFSDPETPIAAGRPDPQDLAAAEAFGDRIGRKLAALTDAAAIVSPEVPGNRPYTKGMAKLPFSPALLTAQCTRCELCLAPCPTGAISLDGQITIEQSLCIFCCACIKNCPENALVIEATPLKEKRQWLHEQCSTRKEPELFL